ncbi:LIM domain kinase 1 [Gossypium arboreum]|uniref:LIM domain kinase 1 n=1 Tax=Gossypium arboreum TaxID=29729 RepID=A0A0B0PIF0_GOSAR|nr:LIM domain kinase 1 [Gossypium arboreum]
MSIDKVSTSEKPHIEVTMSLGIVEDRHHTIEPYFGACRFDLIGVPSWLFKWPIFVHMGRDMGLCLSRVQHTTMLHDRVSPGVPYNCKLGSSTAKAHGRV